MAMVLWKPDGIAGIWQDWTRRRRSAGAPRARRGDESRMTLFEARHLHKGSAAQVVLEDISPPSTKGALGIMGPNGAGRRPASTC
jgi:hypothetical protein